jgi:hypothetical protein
VIDALVSAVVEVLFEGTGRRRLGLFGKQPHSVAMLFTGMARSGTCQALFCTGHSTSAAFNLNRQPSRPLH